VSTLVDPAADVGLGESLSAAGSHVVATVSDRSHIFVWNLFDVSPKWERYACEFENPNRPPALLAGFGRVTAVTDDYVLLPATERPGDVWLFRLSQQEKTANMVATLKWEDATSDATSAETGSDGAAQVAIAAGCSDAFVALIGGSTVIRFHLPPPGQADKEIMGRQHLRIDASVTALDYDCATRILTIHGGAKVVAHQLTAPASGGAGTVPWEPVTHVQLERTALEEAAAEFGQAASGMGYIMAGRPTGAPHNAQITGLVKVQPTLPPLVPVILNAFDRLGPEGRGPLSGDTTLTLAGEWLMLGSPSATLGGIDVYHFAGDTLGKPVKLHVNVSADGLGAGSRLGASVAMSSTGVGVVSTLPLLPDQPSRLLDIRCSARDTNCSVEDGNWAIPEGVRVCHLLLSSPLLTLRACRVGEMGTIEDSVHLSESDSFWLLREGAPLPVSRRVVGGAGSASLQALSNSVWLQVGLTANGSHLSGQLIQNGTVHGIISPLMIENATALSIAAYDRRVALSFVARDGEAFVTLFSVVGHAVVVISTFVDGPTAMPSAMNYHSGLLVMTEWRRMNGTNASGVSQVTLVRAHPSDAPHDVGAYRYMDNSGAMQISALHVSEDMLLIATRTTPENALRFFAADRRMLSPGAAEGGAGGLEMRIAPNSGLETIAGSSLAASSLLDNVRASRVEIVPPTSVSTF
jgi:hypothetical protein